MATVQILMATFEGAAYLREQLSSIIEQTVPDWELLVHDDGSSDETVAIVREFARVDPRVKLVEDGVRFRSALRNFEHLLRLSTAPYVCFSDQDDVWFDDHLEVLLTEIHSIEGTGRPAIVFADAEIVDGDLRPIAPSLMRHLGVSPKIASSLKLLSARNCVTGCTMILNRASARAGLPFPAAATMHDHWVALSTLAAGGMIAFVDRPLVRYRQHGSNLVGAARRSVLPRVIDALLGRGGYYRQARQVGALRSLAEYVAYKCLAHLMRR